MRFLKNNLFNKNRINSAKLLLKGSCLLLLTANLSKSFYDKNNKAILCDSKSTSNYEPNLSAVENDINTKFEKEERENEMKNQIPRKSADDIDLPFEMMDDDQIKEIQEILENPDKDPEAYRELMNSQLNVQPPPFKNFNSGYKCHSDDDVWTGLKLTLEYSPIQAFKFDFESIIGPKFAKTNKYSFVSMNPSKNDPGKAFILVGRNDPAFVHSMQTHITFSQNDKLSMVANFKKNDPNQSMYEAEYTKSFDRLNLAAKYSNMGSSMACTVNAWKNTHLGLEANMNPKTGELMYSYAISTKPHKKLGLAIMYLSYMPMISFDVLLMVSLLSVLY